MRDKTKILYVTYDGLLEPLGQSQILSYLRTLSKDFQITILSFEKKEDWLNEVNVRKVREIVNQSSLEWVHLSYSSRPYLFATLYDILKGTLRTFLIIAKRKIQIVHARGDISALIAFPIVKFSKVKLIFDMRGFWADERVDWGIWNKKNQVYFFFKFLEKKLFQDSDGIVSLTKVGIKKIEEITKQKRKDSEIRVIPTCADLELFSFHKKMPEKITMAHVGAVESRYEFGKTLQIYKTINKIRSTKLHIINKGEHNFINQELKRNNITNDRVEIFESIYSEMPTHLKNITFGAFFPKKGFYLNGYFPTKLGEFLACGRPLICGQVNEDVERIIKVNKVGVVVNLDDDVSLDRIIEKFLEICTSANISERCRKVAEKYFSARQGASDYGSLYKEILM